MEGWHQAKNLDWNMSRNIEMPLTESQQSGPVVLVLVE
jgi:hypothetical protein